MVLKENLENEKKLQDLIFEKIENKTAVISIVGLGYVGLPLAMNFADAGFCVHGIDDNLRKVEMVNKGIDYILNDSDNLLAYVNKNLLSAYNDYELLTKADVICICVPTPLTKNREPDISYVDSVARHIASKLKKGQLVVLESTTYPGTTEEVVLPILSGGKLTVGKDFYLAFSPERVDPGNKVYNTGNTPKVIGGVTPVCSKLTQRLYEKIIPDVYIASSPRVAETEKLLENIFRCVNIAMVNELAILCKKMDINIWEVIELASTKPYGFMPFYPGPGLGGHCIPIDPFYLTWKAREYDCQTKFIELAGEINSQMPYYVVSMISDALSENRKPIKDSKILVLGAAYKKDIDDLRESPSLKIIEILNKKGALVSYNDDFIRELSLGERKYVSCDWKDCALFDCVVISTDHSYYNYDYIVEQSKLVIDTRNASGNKSNPKVKIL